MRIRLIAASAVLALASNAFAVYYETEPNDTIATATPIFLTCAPPSAEIAFGTLAPGDVDFYAIHIPRNCILSAITTPFGTIPANFSAPDTLLGVVSPGGALIIEDDDSGTDGIGAAGVGPVRGSAVRYMNTGADDVYYLRVRGFLNQQSGPYALTVSLFPEPATMGLVLGGLALIARRRSR
jgi:hypothetical protein